MPATVPESVPALGEDMLRRVIDTALDGMVVIDSCGTVLLYNAACERLFGYSADEVLGNNVRLLMTSPDRQNHDTYLENYLRTGKARIIGIGRNVRQDRRESSEIAARLAALTIRERQGLERLVTGRSNKIVAYELGISSRTVEVYRRNVMNKMGAVSLSHLVRMTLVAGMDPLGDETSATRGAG